MQHVFSLFYFRLMLYSMSVPEKNQAQACYVIVEPSENYDIKHLGSAFMRKLASRKLSLHRRSSVLGIITQ